MLQRTTSIIATLLLALGALRAQVLNGPAGPQNGYITVAFDLTASKNLEVTDFSVEAGTANIGSFEVQIWKRKTYGSYVNAIGDPSQWELVAESTVTWQSGLFALNANLQELIPAGETQAFFLGSRTKVQLGPLSGTIVAQNADLALKSGTGSYQYPSYFLVSDVPDVAFAGAIHYNLLPPLAVDLALDAIVAPVAAEEDCTLLTNAEPVTVRVRNLASQTLPAFTLVQLDLDVDGQPFLSENHFTAAALPPGATFSHTFGTSADLSQGLAHTLTASLVLPGDANAANDALSRGLESGGAARVTGLPFIEDFDSLSAFGPPIGFGSIPIPRLAPPPGWTQDPADSTGPFGHYYFYRGLTTDVLVTTLVTGFGAFPFTLPPQVTPRYVRLSSPCIDLGSAINPRLTYVFYYSGGTGSFNNTFSVDVIDTATGTIHLDLDGPIFAHPQGHPIDGRRAVDLSAFVGKVVKIVFRTDLGPVGRPGGLPVFNDVVIEEQVATPGQNLQFDLAEFHIDDSLKPLNANGDETFMQTGGPYFVTKNVGEQITFRFAGVANQPVMLLSGPMNPVAATYPLIGQMDIGGAVDPISGIPAGVVVVADGMSPVGAGPLFVLNGSGELDLWFTIPGVASGTAVTYQAAILTGGANGSWVALSDTIELTIQ